MTAWGRQQRPCAPFYCPVISTSWIPCAHPEDEAEGRGHGAACLDKRAPTRIAGSVNLGPANSTLCALHEDRSLPGSRAFRAVEDGRSEESPVGKECVSKCVYRWLPEYSKKTP